MVTELFTRKTHTAKLKTKSPGEVWAAFDTLLDKFPKTANKVDVDAGKEFKGEASGKGASGSSNLDFGIGLAPLPQEWHMTETERWLNEVEDAVSGHQRQQAPQRPSLRRPSCSCIASLF